MSPPLRRKFTSATVHLWCISHLYKHHRGAVEGPPLRQLPRWRGANSENRDRKGWHISCMCVCDSLPPSYYISANAAKLTETYRSHMSIKRGNVKPFEHACCSRVHPQALKCERRHYKPTLFQSTNSTQQHSAQWAAPGRGCSQKSPALKMINSDVRTRPPY